VRAPHEAGRAGYKNVCHWLQSNLPPAPQHQRRRAEHEPEVSGATEDLLESREPGREVKLPYLTQPELPRLWQMRSQRKNTGPGRVEPDRDREHTYEREQERERQDAERPRGRDRACKGVRRTSSESVTGPTVPSRRAPQQARPDGDRRP
jgi:hypothetical protein